MDETPMTQHTSESSSLRAIRSALLPLHRTLLDAERHEYERSFGRIGSDFYLLQLAAEDPQFAWLRALTGVMVEIDLLLSGPEAVSTTDVRLTATRVRSLLVGSERMTPFQHRYQRILQKDPAVIMAHSAVVRSLPPAARIQIFQSGPISNLQQYGDLRVHMHHPGELVPGHADHGYGPLAVVAESFISPGAVVPMHVHRNEEIVSWVPEGAMRHDDLMRGKLVTDPDHLLVMNAGKGFSHSEHTLGSDAPLRMLQIFVRPSAVGQEPRLQHGKLTDPQANTWRLLVGPEGGDAPFHVRNEVRIEDIRIDPGARVRLPQQPGSDTWLFVFSGEVELDGVELSPSAHALVQSSVPVVIETRESAVLIAVLINPQARVTRAGTISR